MVSVILINYNGKRFLQRCLQSLVEKTNAVDCEVVLVDNASSDDSKEFMRNHFPQVRLVENTENLGFSRANNIGVQYAKGAKLLFLNNDTYLLEDSVTQMAKLLDERPDVGIVGPRLSFEDGRFQLSCGRLPSITVEFLDKIRYGLDKRLRGIITPMYHAFSPRTKEVGWVTGACMMVRRDAFEQIGGFDQNMFMYFEDKDLCKRAGDAGWKVLYYPDTTVVHLLGGSLPDVKGTVVSMPYRESQLYYYRKHLGRFQLSFAKAYLKISGKI